MTNTINTKRHFALAFFEGNQPTVENKVALQSILWNPNDYEYLYALQEITDQILDLKVGEKIITYFNRDNKDSEGIIKRVS